ncbi:hypothetical protein Hamer_G031329, partial [Homarus americanus]
VVLRGESGGAIVGGGVGVASDEMATRDGREAKDYTTETGSSVVHVSVGICSAAFTPQEAATTTTRYYTM